MLVETSPSGTVTAISFFNTATANRHVWVVADPKDLDGLLAELTAMRHITDIATHNAVVK
jgi:hypothetical protein